MGDRLAKDAPFAAFAEAAAALGSGRRAEIVDLLGQGERSVEEIASQIGQSVASTPRSSRATPRRRAGRTPTGRRSSCSTTCCCASRRQLVARAASAAVGYLEAAGVVSPRIGVFGINPHAGEGGLFGRDDDRVTVPAVAALRDRGTDAVGPLGADLMLGPDRRSEFDACVAMYHDQGHVPVKVLAGRTASALTVGAGITFSSVGHGAAFDIAGKGLADPEAVLRAVRLVGGRRVEVPA
jgi:DNA-binding transcriptional ArsR family regulator